jgi:hypothetical protein
MVKLTAQLQRPRDGRCKSAEVATTGERPRATTVSAFTSEALGAQRNAYNISIVGSNNLAMIQHMLRDR